ncbi:MAG: hypothetical protein ACRC2B_20735, partial [Rubrivivax sp.]
MGSATLVLDEQITNPLELEHEGVGDGATGMLRVVHRSITQFRLGVRVQPEGHASRARTRASAGSPGTMAVVPERTASRRCCASIIQAA